MIPIKLSREEKEAIVSHVQSYFEEERSESIGHLAAEQLVDFMMQELSPHIYNKAIYDARMLIQEKFSQIEDDLYTLERPVQHRR